MKRKSRNQQNNFLDSGEVVFYHSESGRLGMKIKSARALPGRPVRRGKELICEEVQPVFLFPFTHPIEFISLRDEKGKEIGIIKNLNDLPGEAKNLLKEELTRRYLIPVIKNIIQIDEEFGNYRWEVITDRGKKTFYVKGRSENLAFINDWRIVLTDIEKCRYEIRDWRRFPRRSRVELEKVI